MSEPELYTREQVEELLEEKLETIQQGANDDRYDNEKVKLYRVISKNQSYEHIAEFINARLWTDRQIDKLLKYARVTLGNSVATTYFRDPLDYHKFYDDKAMMDIDLPLQMTVFDVDSDFLLALDMITYDVGVESRKSIGGKLLKQMSTSTHEFEHAERARETNTGFVDKVKSKFGW